MTNDRRRKYYKLIEYMRFIFFFLLRCAHKFYFIRLHILYACRAHMLPYIRNQYMCVCVYRTTEGEQPTLGFIRTKRDYYAAAAVPQRMVQFNLFFLLYILDECAKDPPLKWTIFYYASKKHSFWLRGTASEEQMRICVLLLAQCNRAVDK